MAMEQYNFDLYMEDCIHLRACRRMSKIARSNGALFGRNCTESCTAYKKGYEGSYITVDEAIRYAHDGADSIRGGYSEWNVYCPCDLKGKTLQELCSGEE